MTLGSDPDQNGGVHPSDADRDGDNGQFWSSRSVSKATCLVTVGAGGPPYSTVAYLKADVPNAVVLAIGVNIGTCNPGCTVRADAVTCTGTVYSRELATSPEAGNNSKNGRCKPRLLEDGESRTGTQPRQSNVHRRGTASPCSSSRMWLAPSTVVMMPSCSDRSLGSASSNIICSGTKRSGCPVQKPRPVVGWQGVPLSSRGREAHQQIGDNRGDDDEDQAVQPALELGDLPGKVRESLVEQRVVGAVGPEMGTARPQSAG